LSSCEKKHRCYPETIYSRIALLRPVAGVVEELTSVLHRLPFRLVGEEPDIQDKALNPKRGSENFDEKSLILLVNTRDICRQSHSWHFCKNRIIATYDRRS
jgi:hypothetical protein